MVSKVRKFGLGLASLALLLGLYLLYGKLTKTKPIMVPNDRNRLRTNPDDHLTAPDGQYGTVGDVGVGRIRKTNFFHRDENGRIDRHFGFEEIVPGTADQWIVRKPFLNLYLPSLRLHATADSGKVQLEDAAGQPVPQDTEFAGNVVVHVVATAEGHSEHSFIYLDDLTFLSSKSLLVTSGSVKFISRFARMTGRGMDLLYDQPRKRIELFRIIELESLRLSSAEIAKVMAEHRRDAESPPTAQITPQPEVSQAGQHYRCLFGANTLIEASDWRVFSHDGIVIRNFFWPEGAEAELTQGPSTLAAQPTDANTTSTQPEPNLAPVLTEPGPEMAEEFYDVVITCDGGVAITPVDAGARVLAMIEQGERLGSSSFTRRSRPDRTSGPPLSTVQSIDHDLETDETVFAGPLDIHLLVDPNVLAEQSDSNEPLPVRVQARKHATYSGATKQLVLEDNCKATLVDAEPNLTNEYVVLAPRFVLDVVSDPCEQPEPISASVERAVADGGKVTLRWLQKAGREILTGVELQGRRFDYSEPNGAFVATGPGIFKLNNAKEVPAAPTDDVITLRKPCYAFLQDFEKLTFGLNDRRIVAESEARPMVIDYFPVTDGKPGPRAQGTAGWVQADLVNAGDRRVELGSIFARDGVTFEDQDYSFAGDRLFYDHIEALLIVIGSDARPCFFNDAPVERVEMNLKNREIKTKISGAGSLRIE